MSSHQCLAARDGGGLRNDPSAKQIEIDVAAAQDEADSAAREMLRIGEEGRQAGGARTLGHRLLDLEEERDGALDEFGRLLLGLPNNFRELAKR